jgi:hypothetical protein
MYRYGGEGQFKGIYTGMFMKDIPFKGCQGLMNYSSILIPVSYFGCGVNDKHENS